jgi:hypothetical protein
MIARVGLANRRGVNPQGDPGPTLPTGCATRQATHDAAVPASPRR